MTSSAEPSYDVIIVGGRPAGASLASRLGARGLRVLVLDRATFPSPPAVPSCPVLYPPGMQMLEEIGIRESSYAHATSFVDTAVVEFDGRFQARMGVPEAFGRRYVRGIDRVGFDEVLWKHLANYPSVTARAGFSVSDLVRDDGGRVVGVRGAEKGGAEERFVAKIAVVGADGRHSLIARKAGAKTVEDVTKTSTVHFAEWEGLVPCIPGKDPILHVVASGRGKNALFFPSAGGRTSVAIHARSDRVEVGGDAERYYRSALDSFAGARRRLVGAKQVGPLLGMKRVQNRYLEPGGPGWVLAGDAFHHKDPVDGQGIYDALLLSKLLAERLLSVHEGRSSWESALASYHRAAMHETEPMFRASMKRLEGDLYEDPPEIVIWTLIRWLLRDPDYQRRFLLFLCRQLPPENWLPPHVVAKAAIRGAFGDVSAFARRMIGADEGELRARVGIAGG